MKSGVCRWLLVVAALALPLPLGAQASPPELVIGLIPEMNVFKQVERFRPLAEYLSSKTGSKVRFTILSRYGNIIDSFTSEKLDGAFFGSFTGALAIQKLGVVPLARPVNLDGESTYHGLIYVRKDSGIKDLAGMRGKKMAFVEKATTAGYIFPLAWLRAQGVTDIDRFFSESFLAGSHDASLYAVLNREADIGTSKNTVFDWVRGTDPRIDREVAILARSAKVPSNGLCVRRDLPAGSRNMLRETLLSMDKDLRAANVLEKLLALRFIETTAADYQPVIDMAKQAGIDLKTYNYRNQ